VEDYDRLADPWEMTASNLPQPTIATLLDAARTCAGVPCP
jgi:hypothetical protein